MDRKRYNVVINGMKTMLKLTEKEAEKRGLSDKDVAKKGRAAANKGRTAANKGGAPAGDKAPADGAPAGDAGDSSDS